MNWVLYFLVLFNVSDIHSFEDYGIDWFNNRVKEKPDLRTKFFKEKNKHINSRKRVTALEKILSNDTEYLDGIPHYKFSKDMNKIHEIETLENMFKSMVKMEGVRYEYKRDMHWRTWREVKYPNNSKIIVCYKCQNIVNTTHEKCLGSGTWVIEENLQCPYEIFSINNKIEICAIDYKDINKIHEKCPNKIKLSDLRDCNNPMETKYLVTRNFKTAPERNRTGLCKEREYCEISTLYQISSNQTVFRIINSTNHVIYSRIMKFGGKNYICIEDCGSYNPVTKSVSGNETPLIVDLLDKFHKNKREDFPKNIVHKNEELSDVSPTISSIKVGVKIYENPYYEVAKKRREKEDIYKIKSKHINEQSATMSSCKKLQTTTLSDYVLEDYYES